MSTFRVDHPGGGVVWLKERAGSMSVPGVAGIAMIGLVWNITADKRAEQEGRASGERLAFLLRLSDSLRSIADAA